MDAQPGARKRRGPPVYRGSSSEEEDEDEDDGLGDSSSTSGDDQPRRRAHGPTLTSNGAPAPATASSPVSLAQPARGTPSALGGMGYPPPPPTPTTGPSASHMGPPPSYSQSIAMAAAAAAAAAAAGTQPQLPPPSAPPPSQSSQLQHQQQRRNRGNESKKERRIDVTVDDEEPLVGMGFHPPHRRIVYFRCGTDGHLLDEFRNTPEFVLVDTEQRLSYGSRDRFIRQFEHVMRECDWRLHERTISPTHELFTATKPRFGPSVLVRQVHFFFEEDNPAQMSPELLATVAEADAIFVHGTPPNPAVWQILPNLQHVYTTRSCEAATPPHLPVTGVDEYGYDSDFGGFFLSHRWHQDHSDRAIPALVAEAAAAAAEDDEDDDDAM